MRTLLFPIELSPQPQTKHFSYSKPQSCIAYFKKAQVGSDLKGNFFFFLRVAVTMLCLCTITKKMEGCLSLYKFPLNHCGVEGDRWPHMMGTQPFNWENKSKSSHSHKLFLFPQKLYVYSKYIRSNYVIYYQQNLSFRCRNNGSPPFVVGYTGVSCCPVQDDVNINLREGRWASLEPNVSHFVCIEEVLFIIYTIKEQQLNQAVSASQMLRWTLTCPAYAVLRSTPALPKSNHPTEQSSCVSIIPAFGKWRQEDEVMVTLSNLQNLKPSLNNTRQNKTKH